MYSKPSTYNQSSLFNEFNSLYKDNFLKLNLKLIITCIFCNYIMLVLPYDFFTNSDLVQVSPQHLSFQLQQSKNEPSLVNANVTKNTTF